MKKTPRAASTYRGARRNLWRKTKQHWDTLKFEEVKPTRPSRRARRSNG